VRFDSPVVLRWNGLGGATAYDVVVGDLDTSRVAGAAGAAITGCAENNSPDTAAWAPQSPTAGSGLFFLVRGTTASCRFGTWDSGGPSQVGTRDEGHDPALTCP
jgi:hypothetical protein